MDVFNSRTQLSLRLADLPILLPFLLLVFCQQVCVAQQAPPDAGQMTAEAATDQAIGLYSEGVSDSVLREIRQYLSKGEEVTSVSLGSHGSYAIVTPRELAWDGLPENLRAMMKEKSTFGIRQIALGPNGVWILRYGFNGFGGNDLVPEGLKNALREVNQKHESLGELAFTATGGWFFVRGTRGYDYNDIPDEMAETVRKLYGKGETVTHVAIGPSGGWVFICGANRSFTAGIPTAMQDVLASINAARSKISCVALAADGGWLVITKPVRTHHSR